MRPPWKQSPACWATWKGSISAQVSAAPGANDQVSALRCAAGQKRDPSQVKVTIEIEATTAKGFDETRVRTVSENAKTLKFEQSGFEEE